ncbi:sortase [Compostimonas suwonensis]|uniref:sortase n=1 Tax=Compostimonas suwonensis TaxID=1048394 RepID=UPI0012FD7ADB|nr:sortase [Compostimonas suwonensis]
MNTTVTPEAPEIEQTGTPAQPETPGTTRRFGLPKRPQSAPDGVTEVLPKAPKRPKAPGRPGGAPNGTPPAGGARPPKTPRVPSLPVLPTAPRQLAPRDARWWIGAGILTVSLLLLGFVAHVAVLSAFQHHRAQDLAYQELRTALAKAEAPVGQLNVDEEMVPIGTPVALLSIPAIGLDEVVSQGTTASALRSGPGHRRDSVMPGQAGTSVIFGRQTTYGGPFGDLTKLQPGDQITVVTGQGQQTYAVFGLRRAGDPLPEPLRSGSGRLELVTAAGLALFPDGALHVDAELISTVQQTPSSVMAYQALPPDEKAMGQDSDAWLAAFFALLLFIAAGITLWWLWTAWGRWQTWLVGIPLMLVLGVTSADAVMNALPNLL